VDFKIGQTINFIIKYLRNLQKSITPLTIFVKEKIERHQQGEAVRDNFSSVGSDVPTPSSFLMACHTALDAVSSICFPTFLLSSE